MAVNNNSDLVLYKVGFNAEACINAIIMMADAYMSQLSDELIRIMKQQIDGANGSGRMKGDAKKVVREIVHEVNRNHIHIESGFDEDMAHGMGLDFYVRVMVVVYGNQAGGGIVTKPGSSTWKKNVVGYGPSGAKSVYAIPQFNQGDASEGILQNTMNEIEKLFGHMLEAIEAKLTPAFFEQFITIGG